MNKILLFIIVITFSISDLNFAQKIEFSGWGATGINVYDRNVLLGYSQEMFYEGKLQANIEYNDNIDAQLDFRGNSIDNSLEFREFSVKFKFAKKLRWKVGNIKKPFGYEQSVNREHLISTDRSYVFNNISKMGYGGRSISIMAYYNYSKKRDDYPYSYYISIFKDNSLLSGLATRGIYHVGDYAFGLSYMFQNKGGSYSINTHGIATDFKLEKKDYSTSVELFFVQDPMEGQAIKKRNNLTGTDDEEIIYATGAKLLTALEFKTEAEVITKIQPFLLTSYLMPNIELTKYHVIQGSIGANFYFTKKIRLRFDGNLILTKNELNTDYSTEESLVTIELQVRF